MTRAHWMTAAAMTGALIALSAPAGAQEEAFTIAVIDDMSGVYSGNGGPNTLLATEMAVEDFGGEVLGRPIEIISADHQNKPDVGSALAREMVDEDGAMAIVNGGASAVGLAIQSWAKERGVTTLITGGYAANFSGDTCSAYGTQWAPSTGELAKAVAAGIVQGGGDKWFFITADYVFGHGLYADASKAVTEAGGEVMGEVRLPLNTSDMSSALLQAQSSGANTIGLANAGPDLVTAIKQSKEFGIEATLAAMLVFANNVVALGLDDAQGMRMAVNFYWDLNEETRAWSERFMERNGGTVPTMGHALAYIATTHYLQAVEAAETDDAATVRATMQELPIESGMLQNATIQDNGRVTMDMYLVEVKSPEESTDPQTDLYTVIETLPAEDLFLSAEDSGCPLTSG